MARIILGKNLFMQVWDWIFPPSCVVCGGPCENGPSIYLCRRCAGGLIPVSEPMCPRCGFSYAFKGSSSHLCETCRLNEPWYDRARAAFLYEAAGRELIIKFKFHGGFYLAPELVRLARKPISQLYSPEEIDLIMPVPLHLRRLKEREYNQSLLLARQIKKIVGAPLDFSVLVRSRWTEPQTQLTFKERAKNVKGAFSVKRPEKVNGKRVLLIDDVFTSGSTANECARRLKEAGATRVEVFTLTRAA